MNLLKPFLKRNLYIRLAKTGSSSLTSLLDKKTVSLTPSPKARRKFARYTYDYRFTVVRNPFDRMVSSWFMVCNSKPSSTIIFATKDYFNPETTLADFVKRTMELRNEHEAYDLKKVDGIYTIPWYERSKNPDQNRKSYEIYWVLSHTLSQVDSIAYFLPVDQLDYVGRYESLNASIEHIKESLSLKGELPHLYSRADKEVPFQSYYDEPTTELVSQMFADDRGQFGYTFE